MVVRRFDHKTRRKVEEMEDELIRMLRLNIEWAERFSWEIIQITLTIKRLRYESRLLIRVDRLRRAIQVQRRGVHTL